MNRRARLQGDTLWCSYGAMTIEQAARSHAQNESDEYDDILVVEVDDEGCVRRFRVERETTWRVMDLRGGE